MKSNLAIFEDYKIRRLYDEEAEMWFFSVVDILQVLLQQSDYQTVRNYWKVLKNRLKKEGSESVTKCNRLKLEAADESMEARGLPENEIAGKRGGGIAKKARLELEEKTGKKVISGGNYLPPKIRKELGGK